MADTATAPTTPAATAASVVAAAVPPPAPVAVAPAVQTTPPPPAVDDKLAAYAKKEADLVKRQQALSGEKEALKSRIAALEEFERQKANALRDPAAFLEPVYGKDFIQKLNEYHLNGKQVTPELVQAEVDKRLSSFEQKQEEKQNAEYAAVLDRERNSAVDFVKQNANDYELINVNGSHALVWQVIEQHYAKTHSETGTGKVLSFKEAADLVEQNLLEALEKNYQSKKWQAKVSAQAAPGTASKPPPTLTPGMTGSAAPGRRGALSDQERIANALRVADDFERKHKERAAAAQH